MKYVLAAAMAAFSFAAQAELIGVAEMGDVRLEFHDTAPQWCMGDAPQAAKRMDYVAKDGTTVRGCYMVTPDDMVLFILEDGRNGMGPKSAIKEPKRA